MTRVYHPETCSCLSDKKGDNAQTTRRTVDTYCSKKKIDKRAFVDMVESAPAA